MKHTITILFGEQAANEYEEKGKVTRRMLNELGGSLETFVFKNAEQQRCFLDGLEAGKGWGDWTETERTEESGRTEYYDEHVLLIGDRWETAMDKLGHNVTSHINEAGECPRCDEIDRILEEKRNDPDKHFWNEPELTQQPA